MIERGTIIQLICVGIFSICLFASGMMSTALTAEAGRAQLVYSDEAVVEAPITVRSLSEA